jgi:dipeptidyl aminopeptidase/acylaminoacyl peptidase
LYENKTTNKTGARPDKFAAYLSVRNAIAPAFTGDGKNVLFLSDISGSYQVWTVALGQEGGSSWPHQLTFYEGPVTGLHPNPAGDAFIISRDQGGDERDQFYLLQVEESASEAGPPVVSIKTLVETPQYKNNFGAWRPDGTAFCFSSNRRHPAFFDIYIQNLNEAKPWMVFQEDATLHIEDWSPDGRYLLIRRDNTNLDKDLFLLDLQAPLDHAQNPRHLTPHQGQADFSQSVFSPDGTVIYTLTDWRRDLAAPARLELATGKLTYLVEKAWGSEGMRLAPDGAKLVYEINEEGYSRLFIYALASGQAGAEQEITPLPGQGNILGIGLWDSFPAWSSDSRRLVFSFHSPAHNADLWLYDLKNSSPAQTLQQITFCDRGGLDAGRFVQPQPVHYSTFDQIEIPALLYLPEGAAKTGDTPFIVFVHGGPEGQTRFNWNPVLQYYVSRGYGILAPNVRGSSGYGKAYLALDDVRKRMDSVADLKAAVEWLSAEGYCDPKRIAVYGQSYGGFMVLAAVTTYPELWAAGVDIYGIANMLSFLENTSSYRLKQRASEYGDPVKDRDFLIEISPIHKIGRIKAPLMVIHGARDPRVPLSESEQIVDGLKERNHPVEMMVFEDEGHGITRLKNKLVAFPAIADFLDRYLKPSK